MSSPITGPTEPQGDREQDLSRDDTQRVRAELADFAHSVQEGHETRDVNVREVLWLGLVVAGVTVGVAVMLLWLLRYYGAAAERRDPELSPLAAPLEPSGPRLQSTPIANYEQFREQQEQHLNSYGYVDREQGVVRIPIERAMEIALEHGLPSPSQPAPPDDQSQAPADPPDNAQPADAPPSNQPE